MMMIIMMIIVDVEIWREAKAKGTLWIIPGSLLLTGDWLGSKLIGV